MKITAPTEQVMQLSGEDDEGNALLAVVVKRTYRLERRPGDGPDRCVLAEEQLPLHTLLVDPDEPEIVLQDADIYPCKPLTDIIVRGHAYPPSGRSRFTASVSVGSITKELSIVGDRRCASSTTGSLLFSEPEPFEKMPLRYDRAYGGVDRVAEAKYGNPYAALLPYVSPNLQRSRHSPYRYPRNGAGKGYLVEETREALEALSLPNIEDPTDRLSPSRLAAGSYRRWPHMPLPWGTDWLSLGCFPRIAYLGGTADHEPLDGDFPEVRRGFMPPGYPRQGTLPEVWNGRARNAGSHGLQIGPLTPEAIAGAELRLVNLDARKGTLAFHLPPGGPEISIDGRNGKLLATRPVLHHVVIEPDHDRVSVLWRGSAPTLRRHPLEELLEMPLQVLW